MNPLTCDTLLQNARVVDGDGGPSIVADVAVAGDRIAAVGDLQGWTAHETIDASGLVVAPAFIDIHTHSDISALHNPDQVSMIYQGVGTQVVGNCGIGVGQLIELPDFEYEQKWLRPHGVRVTWHNLEEHWQRIEEQGIATNYAPLVAHGTIRKRVMGYRRDTPNADELAQMKHLVGEAFEMGVWGFSTGLEYTPAKFAEIPEIAELARVAAGYGGFYATHLRDEGDTLIEATQEAIDIAREACLPLQLSHHKSDGPRNWGKTAVTLQMVERERVQGMDILLDQYPYLAYATSLAVAFLPPWVHANEPDELVRILEDPTLRARAVADLAREEYDWSKVYIGNVRTRRELQGKTIAAAATELGVVPEEFVVDVLASERSFVSAAHFSLSEEDLLRVMSYPHTMIGSDTVATCPNGSMAKDQPHPRCYGTFPRMLSHYVRERGVMSLEEAIRRMTSLPAQRMGWTDRGRLRVGCYADIVVFDFERLRDLSDFEQPHRLSEGIKHLMVNGRMVLRDGEMTGIRAGRVLRKT